MKTKTILSSALLAIAGMAMIPTSVFARGGITATDDDLILSWRATAGTGNTENVEYDLGNVTTFLANASTFNVNFSTDLSNTFGTPGTTSTWDANSALLWSVMGSNETNDNLYYTVVNGGTPNPNPTALNGQSTEAGYIANLYAGIKGQTANTSAYPTEGIIWLISNNTDTYSNVLTNQGTNTSQSFNYFNTSVENDPAPSFPITANLYENIEGTSSPTLLGTFSLSSGGAMTFTDAIPEPSTYALLGLGSLGLLFWFRRRSPFMA